MSKGNYWVISRRKEGWMKVGQSIYSPNTLKIDKSRLVQMLSKINENSLFDFDYQPQEDDKLEINFHYNEKEIEYCFLFLKGEWTESSNCDAIEIMQQMEFNLPPYIAEFKGIIKNAFKDIQD
jgi:hypothetical protein